MFCKRSDWRRSANIPPWMEQTGKVSHGSCNGLLFPNSYLPRPHGLSLSLCLPLPLPRGKRTVKLMPRVFCRLPFSLRQDKLLRGRPLWIFSERLTLSTLSLNFLSPSISLAGLTLFLFLCHPSGSYLFLSRSASTHVLSFSGRAPN